MSTKNSRAMVSLPPEWEPELQKLKRDVYYNNTQAEMYRQLIRAGLDVLMEKDTQNEEIKTA